MIALIATYQVLSSQAKIRNLHFLKQFSYPSADRIPESVNMRLLSTHLEIMSEPNLDRLLELDKKIGHHNNLYYNLLAPEIDDNEYDDLVTPH